MEVRVLVGDNGKERRSCFKFLEHLGPVKTRNQEAICSPKGYETEAVNPSTAASKAAHL